MKKSLILLITCFLQLSNIGFSQTSCYYIVGYFPSWQGAASSIDYSKYTHINYSFAIPNTDGTFGTVDNSSKLTSLVSLGHAHKVAILLSVGGWLDSSPDKTPFETIASNPAYIQQFVNSCADLIVQYNLDGIDLDWEYPTTKTKWNDVITALATKIHGMGKLLTAAVAESDYYGKNYDNIAVLDLVNIMCYGPMTMATDAMTYWTKRGVPLENRMLGVPFYGNDNTSAEHIQKATLASTTAKGIMIWEISSFGDINAIYNTLGGICNMNATPANDGKKLNPVRVYPTIVTNRFTIEYNQNEPINLSIFDLPGNCILIKQLYPGHNEIDISAFTPGLYFLKIYNGSEIFSQKIVKQ